MAALRRLSLHQQTLAGFAIGLLAGLAVNLTIGPDAPAVVFLTTYVAGPIGQIFLRLLFMLVLPLLFAALATGVSQMGDMASLGRAGLRTFLVTLLMSSIAVFIGVATVNLLRPGAGVDPALAADLLERSADNAANILENAPESVDGVAFFLNIIPTNVIAAAADNEVLAVMAFALIFGIGLVLTKGPKAEALEDAIEGLLEVMLTLINLVIRTAPVAVACLLFNLAALFGWDLLVRLGAYAGVVLLALGLHFCLVYPFVISLLGGMSPLRFFKAVEPAIVVAFSTSSSNATLPTSLIVAEERLKLPPEISRFVLTIGATANQNGTALFEGVTVLFLAQFFGVELTLAEQASVVMVCILGGVGTAGVPSGSLPVIAMILGMIGVPPAGIGLVLGIDRFLDMCRTVLNVVGDLVVATVVAREKAIV